LTQESEPYYQNNDMKHCLIALSSLLVAASAFSQSSFQLNNRNTGAGLDAPIFYISSATKAEGADYMVQLYGGAAGTAEGALTAQGAALPFRTGAGAGYINTTGVDTTRTIAGTADGATAAVQLRAWKVSSGATYEAAKASGGGFGQSAVLTIAGGGGLTPPALLTGLASFNISAAVPEPGVAALGLLGA